jgi:Kef-type K+ transport system membrane component KefB
VSNSTLVLYFFAQLAIILIACRIVGWFAHRYLGQPQVVGEMIAGVLLGPSLFGVIAPEVQAAVFPAETRQVLYVLAQLGVGLYMFLVGLDFRRDHFKAYGRAAAGVSIAGMAVPFLLALLLTPWLMGQDGLFRDIQNWQATLFLGAAIAITAFPMLARIIHERGLGGTPVGTLSLAAGAIDDAAAWTVLAIVLASLGAGMEVAVRALVGGVAFAAFMLILGPRVFAPLAAMVERRGKVTEPLLAIVIVAFLLSALAMEFAGIHAVFGGFLLGTAMPRGRLVEELRAKLEPMAVVLLLPMFFTFSGLNTQLSLILDPSLFVALLVLLAAAILAKAGACYAAARLGGFDNRTAMGVGALMNARGLMELIIINIGLERGVIGPKLFSILVVVAIVTTLMATPLFNLTQRGMEKDSDKAV